MRAIYLARLEGIEKGKPFYAYHRRIITDKKASEVGVEPMRTRDRWLTEKQAKKIIDIADDVADEKDVWLGHDGHLRVDFICKRLSNGL